MRAVLLAQSAFAFQLIFNRDAYCQSLPIMSSGPTERDPNELVSGDADGDAIVDGACRAKPSDPHVGRLQTRSGGRRPGSISGA
jgi:hypothetical protein